ncbi:hypothetical protein K502DRAFT_365228 [Neoconidiobolus thromboides FSU 785]|nr:hypothetical protein K502DRAFT_365228 [Neoconidiobolus thromboides FSU 785]
MSEKSYNKEVETKKNKLANNPHLNVFTNDGSFLERFKSMQKEQDEAKKREIALKRKKELEDRIKNRGKRSAKKRKEEVEDKNKQNKDKMVKGYLRELKNQAENKNGLEARKSPTNGLNNCICPFS